MKKITDYTPLDKNPNAGSKRGNDLLESSLEQAGIGRSIVVSNDGTILGGNHVTAKVGELFGSDVPVVEVETDGNTLVVVKRTDIPHARDKRAQELILADNRVGDFHEYSSEMLSEYDSEVVGNYFFEDEWGGYEPEVVEDEPPDLSLAEQYQQKWNVQRGQVWEVGRHRVMCGDSTSADDVGILMGGVRADLILSDPPYNVAGENHLVAAGSYSKQMTALKNSDWDKNFNLEPVLNNFIFCMKSDCSVYIFSSHHLIPIIWLWMREWANHYNWCAWEKVDLTPSLTQKHWSWNGELCAYGTKGNHIFNHTKGEHAPSIWRFERVNSFGYIKDDGTKNSLNDAAQHPTQKPLALFKHIIEHSSNDGMIITDLFLGSGTTLAACQQTGRVGYGMEIHPPYCSVTLERLSKLGLELKLVSDGS